MLASRTSDIPVLRVRDLLSPQAGGLGLELLTGRRGLDRSIQSAKVERPRRALAGEADSPSPGSLQIIGPSELTALSRLSAPRRKQVLEYFLRLPVAALVVTEAAVVPLDLRAMARSSRLAVLTTPHRISEALSKIQDYLHKMLVRRHVIHGVLMDIYGLGTLIIGESGIGKSESALELIERGHRLVSDDIIEIYQAGTDESPASGRGVLTGRSPELTRYFMELRGVGVIDVKDLFGANSIRLHTSIDLVIQLERWEKATEVERLGLEEANYDLLGEKLPLIRMPVGPGRNLAMLIEVAARNHLLKQAGRHPAHRLVKKVAKEAHRNTKH